MYANYMLTGVNNVVFFSDKIFLEAGIEPTIATPATIGVFATSFIMALVGVRRSINK